MEYCVEYCQEVYGTIIRVDEIKTWEAFDKF